ncbi:MAG: HD-GYP domain-containing protein [Gammaproteobacteria bacterium]|jgi:putative nucleotidyltransferase with HDIG domain
MPKYKINVDDLKEGMFVSELDRPWSETDYLLEGVLIKSEDDITSLKRFSSFVYVDTERTYGDVIPHLQNLSQKAQATPTHPRLNTIEKEAQDAETEQVAFQQELKVARKVHKRTRSYIDSALEDVRMGKSVDTEAAKELVTDIASSVNRSPNAMMWLTHMKSRDEYTSIHCMNVCILAVSFGRTLGLGKTELAVLGLGALLHDLGKMRTPLEILNKPGRLTREEFEIMKKHSQLGFDLLNTQGGLPQSVLDIVLHHHERVNGGGYPDGLVGEQIDQLVQIVSIVDVYDAITSDRCYHDGIAPYEALKNMYDWVNENFEKELVEQFIKCLGIYPIGSMIKLNTGQIGIVVSASEKSRLRPIILLLVNSKGEQYKRPKLLNLAHPKWARGPKPIEINSILESHDVDINIAGVIANEAII